MVLIEKEQTYCETCGTLITNDNHNTCSDCDDKWFFKWAKISLVSLFFLALLITFGIEFQSEIDYFFDSVGNAFSVLFNWFPSFIQTLFKVLGIMILLSPVLFIVVIGILSAIDDIKR